MKRHTADVTIVGGGLIGAWCAFFLARRGKKVTLIEKGVVGAQSSGTNFGSLRLQGRYPAQYPLSLRAQELWERLEDLIGDNCEYDRAGHLYCAHDGEESAKLQDYAAVSRSYGLEIEDLGRSDLRRRFPWLGDRIVHATYSARDATANPRLVTPAVARAAKAEGVEIVENSSVTGIGVRDGTFQVTADGYGCVESGYVVNSAGAWGVKIAEIFGETVPLFPAGPPQFVTEPVPYIVRPTVQTVDGSVIARQIPRGNLILTGYPRTASDPVNNRAPVPLHKTLSAMAGLEQIIPAMAHAHVIRVWSGIEGYIPDMIPVIGESARMPGLIHAFGFCGHGFQIGPGVGLCVSEMIADGETPVPLEPFAISRFSGSTVVSEKFHSEFDAEAVGR
ncbi:FAD-binding oxidoreductase [Inquilinus sp. CAU 1745]|uniref:NAD(P)/FAD-dependent oxidoreductase n=1 Tax=Inquilinus sp. CAU 1745 TaxID=3140369 RepID=UPI00325B00BF